MSNQYISCGFFILMQHMKPYKVRRPNKYEIFEDRAEIIIDNAAGEEIARAIISKVDLPKILEKRWNLSGNGYLLNTTRHRGKNIHLFMHRYILGDKEGLEIDHINRNRLDNRRENLRYLTHFQNMFNTNYKGVHEKKDRKRKWVATGGKGHEYLGSFFTFEDAMLARREYLRIVVGI